ncbi:FirrV-1-B19 [Feldmannia irregularis virus a]|uniref:FirrV-1-B19 n=1 Tax=Feldmannia irregularis virus a TaxID=231992 RepID=Q6XM17_9PHYC|nr:FirrV-1-B19 [Feldmannia irregularis virus a]AAR26894.1 FirrV-1-B19 [Feldmannia irregularis virus a]
MATMDGRSCIRRQVLVNSLSKAGLFLRPDSRLCSSYVEGTLDENWDVDRVVHECALMHWLYNYTNYASKLTEAYSFFSMFFTEGKAVKEFIKDKVQPVIKFGIIEAHGGIPMTWPWMLTSLT